METPGSAETRFGETFILRRRAKKSASEKCGVSGFIEFDDSTVAFAGSRNHMQLILEISTQKTKGEKYLYASVDDEVSWQEWDYNNVSDFEESIAKYISGRVNRTVKTVIKKGKNEVTAESIKSYHLD